jgi:hypothetical protein
MFSKKSPTSPGGAPPACRCAVSYCSSCCLALSGPGSSVRAVPATGQAPVFAAATTTSQAAPFAHSAPGLVASPSSLVAGSVRSVPPSDSAGSPVAPVAAASTASGALLSSLAGGGPFAATAATSRAAGIAAALPWLVSGEGPPTQQELRQLQFI